MLLLSPSGPMVWVFSLLGFVVIVFTVEFHRMLDGGCHGLGRHNSVDTRRLGQFKVSLVVDNDGPVSILFRLLGHDDGLLPGLHNGFVLFDGPLSVRGTRKASDEDQRSVVHDQKGLQKVAKAGGKDTQNGRHGLPDPKAGRRKGSGINGGKTDSGDASERRTKDREGKASSLSKFVADHSGKRDFTGNNIHLGFAGKVCRLDGNTGGMAVVDGGGTLKGLGLRQWSRTHGNHLLLKGKHRSGKSKDGGKEEKEG